MLTITVLFTKNTGEPATGLTLADIDLHLSSRAKTGGAVAVIWNGEHPTEEIGGGLYSKAYASDNQADYQYFAWAEYTGATVLDSNHSLYGGIGEADKTGYALASDGLDVIDMTLPTGVASNFREAILQIWRRFFGKTTMTAFELKTYDATGAVVVTTQPVADNGVTQTQGEAV